MGLIKKYENVTLVQQIILLIGSGLLFASMSLFEEMDDIRTTLIYLTISLNMIQFFLLYYIRKEKMETEKIGLLATIICLLLSIPLKNYLLLLVSLFLLFINRAMFVQIFDKKMTSWKGNKFVFIGWGLSGLLSVLCLLLG